MQQPSYNDDFDDDLGGWINCECCFSLLLVVILAVLPFNLHSKELLDDETFKKTADELFKEGQYEKAADYYARYAVVADTFDAHSYYAHSLLHTGRTDDAIAQFKHTCLSLVMLEVGIQDPMTMHDA